MSDFDEDDGFVHDDSHHEYETAGSEIGMGASTIASDSAAISSYEDIGMSNGPNHSSQGKKSGILKVGYSNRGDQDTVVSSRVHSSLKSKTQRTSSMGGIPLKTKSALKSDRHHITGTATKPMDYNEMRLGSLNRMKLDQLLRTQHSAQLEKQAMENHKRSCPFRPSINVSSTVGGRKMSSSRGRNVKRGNINSNPEIGNSENRGTMGIGEMNDIYENVYPSIPVEERLLYYGKQKQQKIEEAQMAKEQENQEIFSFRPQIDERSKKTMKALHPSNVKVEDRLMHYAVAAEESRQLLAQHLREEEDAKMNKYFRPRTLSSLSLGRSHSQTRSTTIRSDGYLSDGFFTRLQRADDNKKNRLTQLKENLEHHSFHPVISRVSEAYAAGRRKIQRQKEGDDNGECDENNTSVHKRSEALYRDAEERRTHMERLRQEKASAELDRSTYKPHSSSFNEKILENGALKSIYGPDSSKNFVERQKEFQKLAEKHASILKKRLEEKFDRRRRGDMRNCRSSALKIKRKRNPDTVAVNSLLLNESSSIYTNTTTSNTNKNGINTSRTLSYHCKDEVYASDDSNDIDEDDQNENWDKLDIETMESQVDRLYYRSVATSQALRRTMTAKKIEECPFKPVICIGSKRIVEDKTMALRNERLYREESDNGDNVQIEEDFGERLYKAAVKSTAAKQKNQSKGETSDVTEDKPVITKKRKNVTQEDINRFYSRQLETVRRKEEIMKQQKSLQILEDIKDCTFQPDIQPSPYSLNRTTSPNDANTTSNTPEPTGVDLFLKRQQLARDKKAEKEENLKRLGKGMKCNGPNYTIVRPFNITDMSPTAGLSNKSISAIQHHRSRSMDNKILASERTIKGAFNIHRGAKDRSSSLSPAAGSATYPFADQATRFANNSLYSSYLKNNNHNSEPLGVGTRNVANEAQHDEDYGVLYHTDVPHSRDDTGGLISSISVSYEPPAISDASSTINIKRSIKSCGIGAKDGTNLHRESIRTTTANVPSAQEPYEKPSRAQQHIGKIDSKSMIRQTKYCDPTPESAELLQSALKRYLVL